MIHFYPLSSISKSIKLTWSIIIGGVPFFQIAYAAEPTKPNIASHYPGKKYMDSMANLGAQVTEDDYGNAVS